MRHDWLDISTVIVGWLMALAGCMIEFGTGGTMIFIGVSLMGVVWAAKWHENNGRNFRD